MPPLVHLVLHGQGHHNATNNWDIRDPSLTELGHEQCRALRSLFRPSCDTRVIVASPLKRAVQTALEAFANDGHDTVVALPDLQEVADYPCDMGSKREALEKHFNMGGAKTRVDFRLCEQGWERKHGINSPAHVEERARRARRWLYRQNAPELIVVTHGDFLHYLTQNPDVAWQNTELRSYTFDIEDAGSDDEEGEFRLLETRESLHERMNGRINGHCYM